MRSLLPTLTIGALCTAATAQAPVILVDQTSKPMSASDPRIMTGGSDVEIPQSFADDFFVTQATGVDLLTIEFNGCWASTLPGSAPPSETYTIQVTDTADPYGLGWLVPGTTIHTLSSVSATSAVSTGATARGYDGATWNDVDEFRITVDFPVGTHLAAGSYFVVVTADGSPGDRFHWSAADPGTGSGPWCSYTQPSGSWTPNPPIQWDDMAMTIVADDSAEPGVGYCFGDGSGTPCPCANDNDGSVPGSGCANGAHPEGARLAGSGLASLSNDTLVLSATGLDPSNSGLYFQANNDLTPGLVWGDGLQCAGGQLKRLGVRFSSATGASDTSAWTTPISVKAGNILPGDTKRYQLWYRDNSGGQPCGVGVNDFNATNGYAVTWAP